MREIGFLYRNGKSRQTWHSDIKGKTVYPINEWAIVIFEFGRKEEQRGEGEKKKGGKDGARVLGASRAVERETLRLAFSSSDKQTWDHDHLGTPPTTDFSFEKTKGMGKNKRGI